MSFYEKISELSSYSKQDRLLAGELSEILTIINYRKHGINFIKNNEDNEYAIDLLHAQSNTFADVKKYSLTTINKNNYVRLSIDKIKEYSGEVSKYPEHYKYSVIIIYHLLENGEDRFKYITLDDIIKIYENNPDKNECYVYIDIRYLKDEKNLKDYISQKNINQDINPIFLFKNSCTENHIKTIFDKEVGCYISTDKSKYLFFDTLRVTFSKIDINKKLGTKNCLITNYNLYLKMLGMKKRYPKKQVYLGVYVNDKANKDQEPLLKREIVFCEIDDLEKDSATLLQSNGKYINFSKLNFMSENDFIKNIWRY